MIAISLIMGLRRDKSLHIGFDQSTKEDLLRFRRPLHLRDLHVPAFVPFFRIILKFPFFSYGIKRA